MDTQINPTDTIELELYRVQEALENMARILRSYDDEIQDPQMSSDALITLMLETDYCLHMNKLITQSIKHM